LALGKDLFICVVYDPPPTSTYYQSLNYDIIECLEKETAQFIKKGNILLCGDFNARTSNAPDLFMDDDNLYLPMSSSYSVDKQILKRLNTDKILDSRGKNLLDYCISYQLRILKGSSAWRRIW
jgi:hypothetical protein